ncbi:reduced growth phenotype protein [Anaeramoeba ignava]|uniref:Reduced growth phenotype protein n=1 Tax=Anaeramoeba ignava TaxID=1746090 RepID=A0A9Q0LLP5_ANAIG|nr:reduced growth phenotype protein [Anaeramoeba ignava]
MSLKMRASLNKNKYISGETLKCQIEMDNSSQNENNKISFLTIQLIGRISPRKKYKPQFEEWINARKLEENQSNRIFLKNSTSLKLTQPEDAWFIIYESNPVIIATDIEMKGNLTFQQEIQIPWELPTSFQGNFAQITYFVKISIQKQFEQINSLKLPLSIFNYFSLFERIKIPNILQTFYPSNSSSLTKIESKKMEQKKSIYFNSVWNLLEPADFLIDKNGKEVLKIQIPKRKFYLGESVVGFFNFYQTENFLCQEVAITLETEETLQLFGKSESKSLQNLSIQKGLF